MVKPLVSVLALSAAISVVFAHAGHALEKRATTPGCSTTYAPVTAYPALDCVPFTQDPQVVNWLKLVDFTKTPTFKPSVVDATTGSTCPPAGTVIPADQCWWTCQKCEAPDDVTTCPTPGTWGLTYDDGPSPDSPRLYDYLKTHNQKATLFVVGSRVISYPTTLKRAYTEGHQIGIHTWSHTAMTSLTNEQVVAELKWTEKAIVDTIGVTPLYWRPPYGDVDNRVRNIATQLGYKTSIWTMDFDTNDWNIPANITTASAVISTFQAWLPKVAGMKTGFIVLEHDLFPQEVDVAITGILPLAYQQKGLTIVPIAQCKNDAKPYKEGLGTFVLVPNNTTSPSGTNSGPKSSPTGVHSGTSGLVPALAGSALAAGSVLAMTLF